MLTQEVLEFRRIGTHATSAEIWLSRFLSGKKPKGITELIKLGEELEELHFTGKNHWDIPETRIGEGVAFPLMLVRSVRGYELLKKAALQYFSDITGSQGKAENVRYVAGLLKRLSTPNKETRKYSQKLLEMFSEIKGMAEEYECYASMGRPIPYSFELVIG